VIEGGKTPILTAQQAGEIGFKLIAFPLTTLWATTKAVSEALRVLREEGSTEALMDKFVTWGEFNEIIGLPRIMEMEQRYKG